ncbi:hypothetical protein PoB_003845400 [Plakobranchus ocellatus]|uniref:Uncharacterized protein n=1 Tax=Plakobranchus ocellatus TaxID=259542 RepID=A0AAV4AZW5_9GAST|nr:hypothetical protein PoB_003845400 [Plakobranchus ocellatus]
MTITSQLWRSKSSKMLDEQRHSMTVETRPLSQLEKQMFRVSILNLRVEKEKERKRGEEKEKEKSKLMEQENKVIIKTKTSIRFTKTQKEGKLE